MSNSTRVAFRFLSKKASEGVAPSSEHHFFDNPEKREVREFADTGAISNDPQVAAKAAPELDKKPKAEASKADTAPPTPSEIVSQPGGSAFSTLNRFVVETEESIPGLPEGHDEVQKHPILAAWWDTREPEVPKNQGPTLW